MRRTRAQMEEVLANIVREKVQELLDWRAETSRPTLEQIEEKMLSWREALGEAATELMLGNEETCSPAVVNCPACGQEAENKGTRVVRIESRVGELEIERVYYYCPRCQAGFFPPR